MDKSWKIEDLEQSNVAFLLKVYENCWAQARHVDEYMERVPRFFLIVVGAVTAAVVALIRFSEVTSSIFFICGVGLFVLAWVGFTASLTIPRYRVIRNTYFNATYLIHKFFADRTQELKDYLGLQIGGTFKGYCHPLRVDFFRFVMMVLMDSSLFAAGLYAMQNPMLLANEMPMTFSWRWTLPVIAFVSLHIAMYYLIILYYKPKNSKEKEHKTIRLGNGC